MLIEHTPIEDAVLPVAAFRVHLRLGSGFDGAELQDAVLQAFLRAAMVAVEARTGKVLIERSFSERLWSWGEDGVHGLPLAPVTRVTGLVQVLRGGVRHDVNGALWALRPDAHSPQIVPTGAALPAVPQGGSVEIGFDAGYATDWQGIPADLRQAVLMLAAHYYEYRDDRGLSAGCMPFGVSSLIERYRTLRLGAAR